MSRPAPALLAVVAVLTMLVAGCQEEIDVPEADRSAAQLFNDRCSGCHSLDRASAQGSVPKGKISYSERTNGPNFNERTEQADDVLFAIRNGGFSGAIMPANIVVGERAEELAKFVCKYAGTDAPRPDSECQLPAEGEAKAPKGEKKPSTGSAPRAGEPEGRAPVPGTGQ